MHTIILGSLGIYYVRFTENNLFATNKWGPDSLCSIGASLEGVPLCLLISGLD